MAPHLDERKEFSPSPQRAMKIRNPVDNNIQHGKHGITVQSNRLPRDDPDHIGATVITATKVKKALERVRLMNLAKTPAGTKVGERIGCASPTRRNANGSVMGS